MFRTDIVEVDLRYLVE